jgi:hypothetical protein
MPITISPLSDIANQHLAYSGKVKKSLTVTGSLMIDNERWQYSVLPPFATSVLSLFALSREKLKH